MEVPKNLPTVKDFRQYGRFHNLPKIDLYSEIPLQILYHIYPNYLFLGKTISNQTLELIKEHCLIVKDQAEYEDKIENLKNEKELQLRRLEDRIHSYYFKKIDSCSCKINK